MQKSKIIVKNRLTKNNRKKTQKTKINSTKITIFILEEFQKNQDCIFLTHWQTKKKKQRVHKQTICSYNFFLDLMRSIFSIVYLIELIRFGCQMDTTTHALPESLDEVLRRHLGLSLGWSQFRE